MSTATDRPHSGESYESSDGRLKKQIGLGGLIALAVTLQIGSGWLLATLAVASMAGPASVLTWVVGAVFFGVIGVSWIELGTMLPRSGAGVRYPRLTHGAFCSWFNGWGYLIGAVALPVIEVQAAVTYVGGNWPEWGLLTHDGGAVLLSWPRGIGVGLALLFVFFLLNSAGARLMSESNKYVTVWKLVIPIVTAALMFTAFSSANFTIGNGIAPMGGGAVLGALASGGTIFAYAGLRQIVDFGGEVVNPQRNIPIAMIVGGLAIPLVVYLLLQVAFIGAIDWAAAGVRPGDWAALVSSDWASAPLLHAVVAAGFGWFAVVLLSDAALSPAATGWVGLGLGTRVVYSMSVNHELPSAFQRINRFGTPITALIGCTLAGVLFFFPAPSWYSFVGMVSVALTLSYLMGGPVMMVLRRTAPDLPRPVRIRAPRFWACAGYVASLMLIYFAGWVPLINMFTAVYLALPLYAAYSSVRSGWSPRRPTWALSAAFTVAWLAIGAEGGWLLTADGGQAAGAWSFPGYFAAMAAVVVLFVAAMYAISNDAGRSHLRGGVWIVGTFLVLLLLSHVGEYGPMAEPFLPEPFDLLVVAVFAVVSFLWAVRSGGPTAALDEVRAAVHAEPAAG